LFAPDMCIGKIYSAWIRAAPPVMLTLLWLDFYYHLLKSQNFTTDH